MTRLNWAIGLAAGLLVGVDIVAQARGAQARMLLSQAVPPLDGNKLTARLVEVTYPPGGRSTPHRHPCAVIGYVVSGAMRMGFEGKPDSVYKRGDTFFERPNDLHRASANASDTEPATFIVNFLCDRETPLTVPDSSHKQDR
ncbi:MAG TPA: cupin domain-containing protein [Gemmatimonadaceae bacterium]|nr:cupin domain-containing protein [Gemmatimonadaceae bacterium]